MPPLAGPSGISPRLPCWPDHAWPATTAAGALMHQALPVPQLACDVGLPVSRLTSFQGLLRIYQDQMNTPVQYAEGAGSERAGIEPIDECVRQ
eukprot:122065-Pelagomonas_calceolata.AAC.1